MKSPRQLNIAGLLHKNLPPASGWYWVCSILDTDSKEFKSTPIIAYVTPDDKLYYRGENWIFWGPLAPPDELTIHLKSL